MEKIDYNTIGEQLVLQVPEFKEIYQNYLKDQRSDNLPHVLFGDFTRFVINHFNKSKTNNTSKDIFVRCMDYVEEMIESKNKDIINVVEASFIENLHQPEDYNGLIKSMSQYFKPKTLELARRMMV